jgi:rhodanese-related sulfurtransferase
MDNEITVIELKKRLDSGENLLVIDVREPYEYDEFNIGARLIPLGELPVELHNLEDHLEEEIIVHCRSGARSAAAQDYMRKQGFEKVRNLTGGILAWQQAFQN